MVVIGEAPVAGSTTLAEHDHHHHGHGAHHPPADFGQAFALAIVLNVGFVAIEAAFGFVSHSVALLADAGHNLSDVLGLAVAWGGAALAKAPPSKRFTYGLRGSSILAALVNALLLLVALGAIVLEAVQRFGEHVTPAGPIVSAVAAVGIAVNLGTALLFARGRKGDINIRGAFLHMAADAAVSAGVVVAGLVIWRTGLGWIDPSGEPGDRGDRVLADLGPAARGGRDVARRGAARDRL
jgi:cobalt-zinc-cadmium efflux system protein